MLPAATLDLARSLVLRAVSVGRTLATAESLTGGLLGAALTSVAGSSAVYRGGLITYATDLKASLGGVEVAALERDGAVSASTAMALATTAARVCSADLALALTGVAGPDRQEGKPAGTVFVGWWANGGAGQQLVHLSGDRAAIRAAAVAAALRIAEGLLEV